MARIPESTIEDVQRATDIVGLIQSYIPLRRAGVNFKATCPFHSEKTPSFIVSPAKQIYHCFGCSAGGNVFHFLMAMEKITFFEAVKDLAQKAGIALPVEKGEASNPFQSVYYELHQFATQFYISVLRRTKPALDYLRARGLKPETIQTFQLGFAPDAWDELLQAARKKGTSPEQLEKAGLAVQGKGGWHDRFVNRILFPIFDVKGRVIGFGGRAMGEAMPKYLNSPETDYFKKGKTLYGLHLTKNEIVREKQVLVLEGYMDVLGLYQAGIKHCVATLGTALTVEHVRALTRFAGEVIISYDGDKAGIDASLRGIDLFVQESCQVRILVLPSGFDPDDFVLKKGSEAFRSLIQSAPFFLDYKLDRLCEEHDPSTPYGQRDIARGMLSIIGKIGDEVLRSAWVKKCAERLKLSEEMLRREMLREKMPRDATAPAAEEKGPARPNLLSAESEVLRWLIEEPKLAADAVLHLAPEDFEEPLLRRCFEEVGRRVSSGQWNGISSLLGGEEEPAVVSCWSALAAQPLQSGTRKREFSDAAGVVRRRSLERQIRRLMVEVGERERARQDVGPLLQQLLEKRRQLEKI